MLWSTKACLICRCFLKQKGWHNISSLALQLTVFLEASAAQPTQGQDDKQQKDKGLQTTHRDTAVT